jgi:molybdate transport system regulatory protein
MNRSESFSLVADIRPGLKLWLSRYTEGIFGPGKCQLLKAIDREGSLKAAADSLGISYRKAWGELRKAEQGLGIAFLERRRGGTGGGEMCLNAQAKKWIVEYQRFETEVETAVAEAFARWQRRMTK